MFQRLIKPSKKQSFFLFGARGTGKSTWLRSQFAPAQALWLDLLDPEVEDRYRREPRAFRRDVESSGLPWVVVDEVQKLPRLLDQVHALIESSSVRFALTGSSARKLKSASANLLAGRAHVNFAFPLTGAELADRFDLDSVLRWGSLPKITSFAPGDDDGRTDYLRSYALTYLREEIQLEQVVRKIDPFRDFLEIAAVNSGKAINASRIAAEAGVDYKSVQNYFAILEATWIGFHLPAYHRSIRKSQRTAPKFYLFDLGVRRALERSLDVTPKPGTSCYGEAFEHWVIQEIHRHQQYRKLDYRLCYLATHGGAEIDLILDRGRTRRPIAIEIKSSDRIDEGEVRKLEAIAKDLSPAKILYLSRDPHPTRIGRVTCLPWHAGITEALAKDQDED